MKCPGCGYVSFDLLEACKNCGAPLAASAAAPLTKPESNLGASPPPADPAEGLLGLRLEPERPASGPSVPGRRRHRPNTGGRDDRGGAPVEMLDDDAMELGESELHLVLSTGSGLADRDDGGSPFHVDDDLFQGLLPGAPAAPGTTAAGPPWAEEGLPGPEAAAEPPGPAFVLPDEDVIAAAGEPIIDRDDEVPERFWAPQVAGLGRRAAALLVDQAVLAAILGLFFFSAFLALKISGFDTDFLLAPAGLRAASAPFAVLAAVLSFVYHAYFHGSTGRTPGKALAGIEVRTGDDEVPTWARAILRWFCAALGLACAGVGFAWAIFEPSRLGWADRLSGTMIARQRRAPPSRR